MKASVLKRHVATKLSARNIDFQTAAKECGVSRNCISRLVHGKTDSVSDDNAAKIIRWLGFDPSQPMIAKESRGKYATELDRVCNWMETYLTKHPEHVKSFEAFFKTLGYDPKHDYTKD